MVLVAETMGGEQLLGSLGGIPPFTLTIGGLPPLLL